jgi:CRISPR-associated endoribonuclease Cas6
LKIYQLKVSILLKNSIELKDVNIFLAKNINYSFLQDEYLKKIHDPHNNKFKPYVFGNLFPFDTKSKMFYQGKV